MRRFVYTAGITGVMQVATLVIMTRLVSDASRAASLVDRKLPPVTEIGAASMIAVAVGVIYNAAYLPKHAQTGVAVAILVVAAALQATNAFLLSRVRDFAWERFRQVAGWVAARLRGDRRDDRVRLRLRPHPRHAARDPDAACSCCSC